MKAFKAYDIRGEWGKDLNEEIAYRIGFFLHDILDAKTILVGRDIRLSSDAMFKALTQGITDSGVDVDDIGLSTTPMVYWSTARYGYDASVMITASHNPKNHNGLKISKTNALPVGYDTGLHRLEALVESEQPCVPSPNKGVIRYKEVKMRQESVFNGLKEIKSFATDNDIVLIHDAARPLISKEIISNNIEACLKHDAVTTALLSKDTVIHSINQQSINDVPNRKELYQSQTPQTFRLSLILKAHEENKKSDATDDAQLVLSLGKNVFIVEGSSLNFKVTTDEDLTMLKALIK